MQVGRVHVVVETPNLVVENHNDLRHGFDALAPRPHDSLVGVLDCIGVRIIDLAKFCDAEVGIEGVLSLIAAHFGEVALPIGLGECRILKYVHISR